ncbi:hypothetical protein GCM10014719_59180 [Planomonospora parontospora subsp. antibiotica]|nr:hypothetical protein GCM10014719_59180 [Planomonospora parontospora subsp. antibiotica]GII19260.1 hypothetical protein Ppa05_59860 [Planomonospora parontospora subsp. antibiotica]
MEAGRVRPGIPAKSPALIERDSPAYFAWHRLPDAADDAPARLELGAIGHGPGGRTLAARLAAQIHAEDHDRTARPTLTVYPAGTPADELPAGHVIVKRATQMIMSWPERSGARSLPGKG